MLLNMEQLTQFRLRNGVTMYALAKKMGVTRGYLNNIEKGINPFVSDEQKEKYLQCLYAIVAERKKNN